MQVGASDCQRQSPHCRVEDAHCTAALLNARRQSPHCCVKDDHPCLIENNCLPFDMVKGLPSRNVGVHSERGRGGGLQAPSSSSCRTACERIVLDHARTSWSPWNRCKENYTMVLQDTFIVTGWKAAMPATKRPSLRTWGPDAFLLLVIGV